MLAALYYRQGQQARFDNIRDVFVTATQNALKGDTEPATGDVFDHVEPVREEEELDVEDLTDPVDMMKIADKL